MIQYCIIYDKTQTSKMLSSLVSSPSVVLLTALLVTFLLLLPYAVRVVRRQWRIYVALRQLPTDPDQHWLMGHASKIAADLGASLDMFVQNSLKYGKIVRLNYGPFFNSAELFHPDTVKAGLGPDPKSEIAYSALFPWLGNGLLLSSGKVWARNRRLLTGAFHFDVLRPYIGVYTETSSVLLEMLAQKSKEGSVDVCPYVKNYTLDVMLRCACSYESNCQTKQSPYVSAVYELSDLVLQRSMFFPAYWDCVYFTLMPSGWRFKKLCKLVHNFSMEVIKKRRAELNERKTRGEDILTLSDGKRRKYLDFIDILLKAQDENGCGLTDEEIRAEVDTFLFEGHDTTAAGLSWTLYNLARYPEHQEKCRSEVDKVFEDKDEIEWEDLKKLTYLKYCIKESIRLFPPVAIIGRELTEDREFDGHVLPEGSWVFNHIYAVHRQPDIWENPEEFDPLRFTPENSLNRHKYAFIPFSAGPRNCIGQEFAMNEQLVLLSHVLRKFDFSLDESHGPVKTYYTIINHPIPGVYLKLNPRI